MIKRKKNHVLILCFFALANSFLYGQNLDFIKNESLKEKIETFKKFVKKSPTIDLNYRGETIFLLSNGYNAFSFSLLTRVGGDLADLKCYELNENLVWVIDEIEKIDDSIIDKKILDKYSDCNNLFPNKKDQKDIPEMINATFSYEFNEYGKYLLDRLNTFDKLLFLSIEFEEKY